MREKFVIVRTTDGAFWAGSYWDNDPMMRQYYETENAATKERAKIKFKLKMKGFQLKVRPWKVV